MTKVAVACALAACTGRPAPATSEPAPPPPGPGPRAPIALTYLGVAGWQIDAGERTILADPYFSRPDLAGAMLPDAAAIARRAPKRAELIVIGHSHVDHLLDAPSIALATGAQILGSVSTAHVARASGVPADRILTI